MLSDFFFFVILSYLFWYIVVFCDVFAVDLSKTSALCWDKIESQRIKEHIGMEYRTFWP